MTKILEYTSKTKDSEFTTVLLHDVTREDGETYNFTVDVYENGEMIESTPCKTFEDAIIGVVYDGAWALEAYGLMPEVVKKYRDNRNLKIR